MMMNTRTRRVLVLALAGAVLVTCAAGLASAQDATPPQPVMTIRPISDGEEHEGALVEYCWPSAAAGVACGTTTERPESTIAVENGDIIAIVIEGDAGPPSQLAITFPEVLDRQGRALQVSLDTPGDVTEWVVDLTEGEHEAVIDAVFADVNGAEGFIRYRFIFEVSAPPPTATPARRPMATPTARPVRPTATLTAVTVEPPTEEIDEEEAIPLGEVTAEPEGEAVEPTPMPTVTLLPTVEVPTQEALETPAAAPQEEAEPMRVIELIAGQLQGPPMLVLESAGEVYVPLAVSYCWDDAAGERECPPDQVIDYPSERLVVPPFGAFLVVTDDPVPETVDFVILAADASAELVRETRAGATLILYTPLIEEQGSYIFAVEAEWPEGNATYYFLLLILEPEALTPPG